MAATMREIWQTRAARMDPAYRDWITNLNYASLMNTGAPIYGHAALTPQKLRRWYLAGIDYRDVLKRAQKAR